MEGQEQYKSKNLIAERNRRNKLNSKLYALRALVPNITKMDKATIIDDAFDYIVALKEKVEDLQIELVELANEEGQRQMIDAKSDQSYEALQMMENCKVEVAVTAMDDNKFLINIVCPKRHGGFTKLMEAMAEIGLEVMNINVSSLKGVVSATICTQAKKHETLGSEQIKECLIHVVRGKLYAHHFSARS